MSVETKLSLDEQKALLSGFRVIHPSELDEDKHTIVAIRGFATKDKTADCNELEVECWSSRLEKPVKELFCLIVQPKVSKALPPPPTQAQLTVEPVIDLTLRTLKRPAEYELPLGKKPDHTAGDKQGNKSGKRTLGKKPADHLVLNVAGWGRVPHTATKQALAAVFKDLGVPIELYRQGPTGTGTLRFRRTDGKHRAIETSKEAAAEAGHHKSVDVVLWIEEHGVDSESAPALSAFLESLKPTKPRGESSTSPAAGPLHVEELGSDDDVSIVGASEGDASGSDADDSDVPLW